MPQATPSTEEYRRVLGRHAGEEAGPLLVMTAGLHGNEPAGIEAIRRVLRQLAEDSIPFRGEIVGLAGNLPALARRERFLGADLNRMWRADRISALRSGKEPPRVPEEIELLALLDEMEECFDRAEEEIYHIDLHTSSSASAPFSLIGDVGLDLPITQQYPVPVVLGLAGRLQGALLNYLDELGHVSLAFEGGKHDDPRSVDHLEAALWLTLIGTRHVAEPHLPRGGDHWALLEAAAAVLPSALEVFHHHLVKDGDGFQMAPGFQNFDLVDKGQLLAFDSTGEILAPTSGRLLLPRYQELGDDGFFLAREL